MLELVWLIPALPLAGFLVLSWSAAASASPPPAGWPPLVLGGSFAATVAVYIGLIDRPGEERVFVPGPLRTGSRSAASPWTSASWSTRSR